MSGRCGAQAERSRIRSSSSSWCARVSTRTRDVQRAGAGARVGPREHRKSSRTEKRRPSVCTPRIRSSNTPEQCERSRVLPVGHRIVSVSASPHDQKSPNPSGASVRRAATAQATSNNRSLRPDTRRQTFISKIDPLIPGLRRGFALSAPFRGRLSSYSSLNISKDGSELLQG